MKPPKSSFEQNNQKNKSYTRKHALVVDTSLLFCACEHLWGVLLRCEAVIELDLTSSFSLRACWLGPESFKSKHVKNNNNSKAEYVNCKITESFVSLLKIRKVITLDAFKISFIQVFS